MKKREQEILERQEAQEQHEAAQKKRVSNGRLNEMKRRDLTEYGEEEEDGMEQERVG
jgi:hypothetical protein